MDCFRFWNDVFRKRNVMHTSCVMTASPSEVPFGRVIGTHHITLRQWRNSSLCRKAQHHLPARANITFYSSLFSKPFTRLFRIKDKREKKWKLFCNTVFVSKNCNFLFYFTIFFSFIKLSNVSAFAS